MFQAVELLVEELSVAIEPNELNHNQVIVSFHSLKLGFNLAELRLDSTVKLLLTESLVDRIDHAPSC